MGFNCVRRRNDMKKTYSLSTVTLDDILQDHLTTKHLLPNYPLFHDPIQPNLVSLARQIRQKENFDEILPKIYSKIFNHEERLCCTYDGLHGKLVYPKPKRLLFDLMIKLTFHEYDKRLNENEKKSIYSQCEKQFAPDGSTTKLRGINYEQVNSLTDEQQFVSALFRLIIPQDDQKKMLAAKQNLQSNWNDNETCLFYARPIHLLTIKQKWMDKFPVTDSNEAQRWTQCIDWFFEPNKVVRPSKRKTTDVPTNDDKRRKSSLTLEEKLHQIDRTKFDVFEYATQYLQLVFDENPQTYPTFEQLLALESCIQRYYWTNDFNQTWKQILETIQQIYQNVSTEKNLKDYLIETHPEQEIEINRLLQIKSDD